MKRLLVTLVILLTVFALVPAVMAAETTDVYVSATGSDDAAGTAAEPVATLSKAMEQVEAGGTIHVVGTVEVPDGFKWTKKDSAISITGGTLDYTPDADGHITIGNAVTFHHITLKFDDGDRFYANGLKVVLGEGLTIDGKIYLYGGARAKAVESTNLTVLSGTYASIFGAGHFGGNQSVNGNVNLYVGGTTNADADITDHTFANDGYNVFGAGWNSSVGGKINMTFADQAKARYLFGGGRDASTGANGINLEVSGGQAMTIYGGSKASANNGDISLKLTGGEAEQIFGGCLEAGQNGNVNVQLLGGKVTRRVYAGCYNDDNTTDYAVSGKISLSIAGTANLTLDKDIDRAVYARSRYITTEASELTLLDKTAVEKYNSKLGAVDSFAAGIMNNASAADTIVRPAVAKVNDDQYDSLQKAVDNANGAIVTLIEDCGNATVNSNVTIDLNGFNATGITVAEGAKLQLIDSTTNDFTGNFGTAEVTGKVESFVENAGKSYLVIAENGKYSAHRYAIRLTHMNLKPGQDALGFKSRLYGDEIVYKYVSKIGFNLWVTESNVITGSKEFTGSAVTTMRLINILASNGGETTIYGNAFITFSIDEKTVTTVTGSTSMRYMIETINSGFGSYTKAQRTALKALVDKFADKMTNWEVSTILNWAENCPVSGTLEKIDGTKLPETITFMTDDLTIDVPVDQNGKFKTTMPNGHYSLFVDGYRLTTDSVELTKDGAELGKIKLLQLLSEDCVWNNGATLTENGASVSVQTGAKDDSMVEYKIGDNIEGASSWTAETYVVPGSTKKGFVGFSIGGNDANNGLLMIRIDYGADRLSYATWGTYLVEGTTYSARKGESEIASDVTEASGTVVAKDTKSKTFKFGSWSSEAIKSAEGYKLTLKAENIGTETESLTFYINDVEMLKLTGLNIIGAVDGGKGVAGQKLDLSDVHVSLNVCGNNVSATFSDYFCTAMSDGAVSGKVEKLDGTAGLPETITLKSELNEVTVDVAADGTFNANLPTGIYTVSGKLSGYRVVAETVEITAGTTTEVAVKCLQNTEYDFKWWQGATVTYEGTGIVMTTAEDANKEAAYEYKFSKHITTTDAPVTSWSMGAHIGAGSTGNVGFSLGTQAGENGTIFFYVNKDTGETGYFSWGTFKYSGTIRTGGGLIDGNTVGHYPLSDEVKAMLNAEEGYDLKLVATNIDGRRSGWLTLYVNDTAVLELYNNFVGVQAGGKGVDNQRVHLSQIHLSMVAQGTGISATFKDYYYKTDAETAVAAGKVTGTFKKLDGTAVPSGDVLVKFGNEYRLVRITEGAFTTQLPVGTYEVEYTVAGYRTACGTITVTEGDTTEVTIKLLQLLSEDCVWNNGATLTENGASVSVQTGAKDDSMVEYKIGDNIEGASSWTAETYVVPGSTKKGFVGFSIGGNDANNGLLMIRIDYGADRLSYATWGTYLVEGTTYSARKGESEIASDVTEASGTVVAKDTKSKTFKFGSWSSEAIKSAEGYKLTLKAENIGTETESLTFYINDVEMLKLTGLNIIGAVDGGKGVAGQELDLSDVHVSLNVCGNDVSAIFSDYFLKVEK